MKFLIVGSPKTGNVWLEKLLSKIYSLPILDLSGKQEKIPTISEQRFIAHQHYQPTPELLEWGEREGVRFLALTRHPADLFVSMYYYVNNFAPLWKEKGWIGSSPAHVMIGEAIDSPIVLNFLRTKFKSAILGRSIAWLQNGKALIVRYEDLHKEPVEILIRLTDQIEPVKLEQIEQAIDACRIDKMRQENPVMRLHCRKGKVGDWQEELNEAHIAIFREYFAQELALLGYTLSKAAVADSQSPLSLSSIENNGNKGRELPIPSSSGSVDQDNEELKAIKAILQVREEELASTKRMLKVREEELTALRTVLQIHEAELAKYKNTSPRQILKLLLGHLKQS